MNTKIMDCGEAGLRLGAQLLKQGELVAFPTETVYGLGGNGSIPAQPKPSMRPKAGRRITR